jgi:very-short-patch-repair endonuclease
MPNVSPVALLSELGSGSLGVFRGRDAVAAGVTRKQLCGLGARGVIDRIHPDTYRLIAVPPSNEQRLRAALLWAGADAAAAGRSAGEVYVLEGVHADLPEIVVPPSTRAKSTRVIVHHGERLALMVREVRGLRVTGTECTMLALAASLDGEALEIACEDARRRRLTSVPALRSYLERFGRPGRPGVRAIRRLLDELDPVHASRSTLEVKTRRLLVAHRITGFEREFPLEWNGVTYHYDFGFPRARTILETNGRRWHDDSLDFERDNEKWSVPGRHGFRMVFATWEKVTRQPERLVAELVATLRGDGHSGVT